MPSGAGRKLLSFEQNNIPPTAKGQMVGQTAAHDSAANDDDLSRLWKFRHTRPPSDREIITMFFTLVNVFFTSVVFFFDDVTSIKNRRLNRAYLDPTLALLRGVRLSPDIGQAFRAGVALKVKGIDGY
ncbi:hypothetical protein ABIB73_007573 [Bradyrhizobium sp. F1.4.3]|uniref:hypothetical protein n=1 Tax=Bradyrhizobium sp. F1.4.3 TaxID=3156356 RepID=UPI003394ED2D